MRVLLYGMQSSGASAIAYTMAQCEGRLFAWQTLTII